MTASLILLALVKSGHEAWIPGGPEALWGPSHDVSLLEMPVAGKIGHVMIRDRRNDYDSVD